MALDVAAVDAAGEWLRHVPRSAAPASRPTPVGDNRWQRGAIVDGLYFAADEDTLWAEWYRHLAERGLPPARYLPRDVWRFRVGSLDVADLSSEDRLARVGLKLPEPGRKSWPRYQAVGETLWREGWPGLIAPSAARPLGVVLCMFVDARLVVAAEPVPPPRVVVDAPTPPTGMRT